MVKVCKIHGELPGHFNVCEHCDKALRIKQNKAALDGDLKLAAEYRRERLMLDPIYREKKAIAKLRSIAEYSENREYYKKQALDRYRASRLKKSTNSPTF